MNYTVKKLDNKKTEIEIKFSHEEWEASVTDAYNKNKGNYTIEGFRKGKAPRHLIEKMYGANVFFEEALNDSFYKAYEEILEKDKSIEPVEYPTIDIKDLSEEGVVLTAVFSVRPEIKIGAYKNLKVTVTPKEVTDKDVEEAINQDAQKQMRLVEVTEPIKKGNVVNINFEGSVDGKVFDGGTATDYDLEIGSKSFIDNFEDQLIGLNCADEKDVLVTFPENYGEKSLAGKPAVFKVKINAIKEKQIPEINDEFASNVSEFNTLEEYKTSVKEKLVKESEKNAKIELENKIIDEIVKNTEIDVPDCMIHEELDNMFKDLEYRLMYQGISLEDYAKYMNTTVEEMKSKKHKEAENSVKVRLVLQEIVVVEKLNVTDAEIDEKLETQAKLVNKSLEEYKKGIKPERINYMKNDLLMNKLLSFLTENNK